MNVTTHIHSIVRGTAGFAMAISLVGCSSEVADDTSASSTEDSNASVAEVYTSLSEISNGSDVVVGTVTGQNVVRDITETDDFTISEFKVTDVIKGDVAEGDTLEVRQIGSSGEGMDSESDIPDEVSLTEAEEAQ
jgi:hypothetical protein